MGLLYLFIVVGSAAVIAVDASNLGAQRGRLGGGFHDMGPVAWFFAVILLWIVAVPASSSAGTGTVEPWTRPNSPFTPEARWSRI